MKNSIKIINNYKNIVEKYEKYMNEQEYYYNILNIKKRMEYSDNINKLDRKYNILINDYKNKIPCQNKYNKSKLILNEIENFKINNIIEHIDYNIIYILGKIIKGFGYNVHILKNNSIFYLKINKNI